MISHTYRCIFVHIPKTGGSSIEDLIWPPRYLRTTSDLWMGLIDGRRNKYQTGGLQHLQASQIKAEVGCDVFNRYFKFSIVRNPWDKVISQYVYMTQRKDLMNYIGMNPGDDLKSYLHLIARSPHVQWADQLGFLIDKDENLLVDYVGRFEDFEKSVHSVADSIGIQVSSIPHQKKGQRGRYQNYYDPESIETVRKMYQRDIEAFGYEYDA